MHIGTLRNTDLPLTPPTPLPLPTVRLGILESYRVFGSSQEKRERAGGGRVEGGWREGGEAASSVSSEIGGAGVTKALFHRRDRERRKRQGWRKAEKKPPQ